MIPGPVLRGEIFPKNTIIGELQPTPLAEISRVEPDYLTRSKL
jgi:hypothetical protein